MKDSALDPVPDLTPEQRNGRQLLVLALMLLGVIPLSTLLIKGSTGPLLIGGMLIYAVIFAFAFRGGQIALGLLKGFAALMSLAFTVMLLTLVIWHFNGDPAVAERATRSPLEIIAPAFCAYFAVAILFFSKSVRAFLESQRQRIALIALLLLPLGALNANSSEATPQPVPLDRYDTLISRSPFAPATAPVAPPKEAPSFAKDYYLTGLAVVDGKAFASFSSRDAQTRFSLLEGDSYEGMTFSGVEWQEGVGRSRVTLMKGATSAEVTFDEAAMQAPPLPTPPQQTANANTANGQRGGNSREDWQQRRERWRQRGGGDWQSSEQRRFMREQRRAHYRAMFQQGGMGGHHQPPAQQQAPRQ